MRAKLNFRINTRIYALVLVSLIACFVLSGVIYQLATRQEANRLEAELQALVQLGVSVLEDLDAQVLSGERTRAQAQADAVRLLNGMRFGDGTYLFGFNREMDVLIHGGDATLIGTNQANLQDPEGTFVYRELLRAALDGSGVVRYHSYLVAEDPGRKLSFAVNFESWGWIVAAARGKGHIAAEQAALRNAALRTIAISALILFVLGALIARSVTKPLFALNRRTMGIVDGDLESEIPGTAADNELGELSRAIEAFRAHMRHATELEQQAETARKAQEAVVRELGNALQKLADGDLTATIEGAFPDDYESLRHDFNSSVAALRETISDVSRNAETVRSEASNISAAAEKLSLRTERQAAALEETAVALDEMTSAVREAAEDAEEARIKSDDTRQNATIGGDIAEKTAASMTDIQMTSGEISKITTIIDDIAFQTNLLALNAGVEAARAGQAGSGFAIVASEVRSLAKRSSEAANEINELITSSIAKIDDGVLLVGNTKSALEEIITAISEISEGVTRIATGSKEQSTGLNEVNVAMNELDQMTQQNAAMFEETSAASMSLRGEADSLASTVAKFNLGSQIVVPSDNADGVVTSFVPAKEPGHIGEPHPHEDAHVATIFEGGFEEFQAPGA